MDSYVILAVYLIFGLIIMLLFNKLRQYKNKINVFKTKYKNKINIFKAKYENLVAVPREDIDRIEEARLLLWRIVEKEYPELIIRITEITQPMWYITHYKYDKIEIDE